MIDAPGNERVPAMLRRRQKKLLQRGTRSDVRTLKQISSSPMEARLGTPPSVSPSMSPTHTAVRVAIALCTSRSQRSARPRRGTARCTRSPVPSSIAAVLGRVLPRCRRGGIGSRPALAALAVLATLLAPPTVLAAAPNTTAATPKSRANANESAAAPATTPPASRLAGDPKPAARASEPAARPAERKREPAPERAAPRSPSRTAPHGARVAMRHKTHAAATGGSRTWAAQAAPPPADEPTPASSKPPGKKKISLDEFLVEGKREKPSAYYILRRSQLDHDWARLDARFSPLVLESVQDPLF